ncbi:hypothetical protein SAMN06265222_104143 [Neorhodopirellula lusitana]|uniref:Uncharacterized protein n=1 Tax=Neorhodopirellula lusitana TaxID=445327 RepID=A0ABY1Q096_9BACT|nr:hypothetical protein SAMN06265222_104143 [Neorhodopirellula lusitana]
MRQNTDAVVGDGNVQFLGKLKVSMTTVTSRYKYRLRHTPYWWFFLFRQVRETPPQ